jgi:hypothetical protein
MKTKKDIPVMTEEEKQKGIDDFIKQAKDVKMNVSNTDSSTSTDTDLNTNPDTNYTTILSTNISTNKIIIERQLKYSEERKQRAYYLKLNTIKKLDRFAKKYNLDKSDIVNESLELFFNTINDN